MYLTKESENKDAEYIFCNRKCSEDAREKNVDEVFQLFSEGAPGLDCTGATTRVCRECSVIVTNRLKAEMVFA